MSQRTGAGLDPCAALRVTLDLAPGERGEITCMLGQAESVEQARKLVLAYRDDPALGDRACADQGMVGCAAWHH